MSKSVHLLLTLLMLAVVLPIGAQDDFASDGDEAPLSAWHDYMLRHPGAADDDSIGPLERRVLHTLRPDQAEAFFGGTDPRQIVLADGETLADFLARTMAAGPGLAYVPVDQCRLFATAAQTAPVTGEMAADEIREFVARGSGVAHTDQGGVVDCGIPAEAVAVVTHFRLVATPTQDAEGFLKAWAADAPETSTRVLDYQPVVDPPLEARFRFNTMAVVELCPLGSCATGEFKVKTASLSAHVRGDVMGYFRPIVAADVPGAGDADTLDGLDSTEFALATHTHDGGDIVSGIVGEPFIDPLIARDSEVVDILKAGDGSGSGFDADLLDGKQLTAFRPRPANVVIVDPTDGDYATIQAALDAIGTGLPAATTTNRYLIRVGIGTYNEQVTMKPFVDIEGKGKKATIISAASQVGPTGTLECADDAEVRNLTIESTGGSEKAIAIRCLGTSPMLTHVKATATGATGGTTPENIGLLNDGAAATPVLTGVHIDANPSPGIAVVNQNGAMPTIRDSDVAGADSAIENRDTATAKVANTALAGGADFMAPAVQASYMCVRAYDAGTLAGLNAECFPNTPPTAVADAYSTLGNTLLEVTLDHAGAASGVNTTVSQPSVIGETTTPKTFRSVLENDTDAETVDKNQLAAAVVGGTVTAGAVVNMFADGTFEYSPPVGFTGADTFDYTVTDPGGLMDTGTVTVTVSSRIWYVDNSNVGTADGRSTTPYTSLAPIDADGADDGKDGVGDTIFVFTGAGSTGEGILLENNQILQGNEIALAPAGFEYAGGGNLVAAGTAPTLGNAGGDVIELASGNTVRGLDIAATAGRAVFGNSSAGGTIDAVGTTGSGVLFTNATGTIAISNLVVGSSSAAGIDIQGGSAIFTFDSFSSITSPSAAAFNVNGGTAQVTFDGGITQANNFPAVSITGHSVGTVTFQAGTISATNGNGLQFDNADGAAYNFNGPVTLNGGDAGIDILNTSAGTFTFTNATITSPTNGAFNIDGSTASVNYNGGGITQNSAATAYRANGNSGGIQNIGVGITANTSTATGISLTGNTGATINFTGALDIDTTSAGGFVATGGGTVSATATTNDIDTTTGRGIQVTSTTIGGANLTFQSVSSNGAPHGIELNNTGTSGGLIVTGDGTGAANGSGGSIANSTNDGISLTSTRDVSITQLNVSNSANHGIDISSVTNFTFEDATLIGDGAQDDEHSVRIVNLFGTSLIEDVQFDNINEDGIEYLNNSADDGTRDVLTVRRGDFDNHDPSFGEMGIDVQATGTALMGLVVDDSTFDINTNGALGVIGSSIDSSNLSITIQDSMFNAANAFGAGTIQITNASNSTGTNMITGNDIDDTPFNGILVNNDDDATSTAVISNNNIDGSGVGVNNGFGISVRQDEDGSMTVLIDNNDIGQMDANQIRVLSRDTLDGTGAVNATITNNTALSAPGDFIFGLEVSVQDTNTGCADIRGNNFIGNDGGVPGFGDDIRVNESGSATLNIEQTDAANITALNNGNSVSVGGTPIFSAANCPTP